MHLPVLPFMRWRHHCVSISVLLLLLVIGSFLWRGMQFGIDFTGGYLLELEYAQAVELQPLRQQLTKSGYPDAVVQHLGDSRSVLVRLAPNTSSAHNEDDARVGDRVLTALRQQPDAETLEMRRVEYVGPQVGEELQEQGGLALLYAMIAILLYISLRFEKRFALGAVAALIHDVLLTVGLFSLFGFEFDLSVLAALLAVIGYSLNDTIVIFDRIRERFRRFMGKENTLQGINAAINQTLSRTLITSLTTLLVLFSLLVIGGESIHSFAATLIIGVVIGTYSSIYIASSTVLFLGVSHDDLLQETKKDASDDGSIV